MVYQMGKVGSRSVVAGLEDHGFSVSHVHTHEEAASLVAQNDNLFVISGIRDVMARTIAGFFENIDRKRNTWWYLGKRDDVLNLDTDTLIDEFRARFPAHVESVVHPWFEEFSTVVGSDVFAQPFNQARGFDTFQGRVDGHIYRLENIDHYSLFFSRSVLPGFQVSRQNQGVRKWYADIYKRFLREISFSRSELDIVYTSKLMNHFYDSGEIVEFRRRWDRGAR